jgi:hypothetical protein
MRTKPGGSVLAATARRPIRVAQSVGPCEGDEFSAQQCTSIQSSILQVLRARGGRLWLVDLVFELRWRGARPELVSRELENLVQRGLVRGPLAQDAYELTAGGWDLSRQS